MPHGGDWSNAIDRGEDHRAVDSNASGEGNDEQLEEQQQPQGHAASGQEEAREEEGEAEEEGEGEGEVEEEGEGEVGLRDANGEQPERQQHEVHEEEEDEEEEEETVADRVNKKRRKCLERKHETADDLITPDRSLFQDLDKVNVKKGKHKKGKKTKKKGLQVHYTSEAPRF